MVTKKKPHAPPKPPAPPKAPATRNPDIPAPGPSRAASQSKSSWKDHPVYVLGGVVVATSAAVAAVFYQVVLPAREAEAKSKADKLEAAQAQLQSKLTAKDSELGAVRRDLQASKDLADALHLELRSSLTAQLFSANDPYPNGLRSVRVGEPVANVARAYPRATIDKSKDGVTALRRYHPTFANIYYYFDEDDAKKTITHIRFDVLEESNPGEFLRRKLRDALGPPRLGAKTEHYAWIRDGMPGVFQAEPYSYLVMVDGHAPRWWKPKP